MTVELTTKRKRIVTAQSRNGCYTCKARRIKCDETRPTCLRCERSKHSCLGYRDQSPTCDSQTWQDDSPDAWQSSLPVRQRRSSPTCALSSRSDKDPSHHRFTSLACTALQSSERKLCGRSCSIWTTTLPQYSYSVPVVASALAALGSALDYRSTDRSPSNALASTTTTKLYVTAISEMQMELARPERSRECILLACLLLGSADIVQWRELSAMTHVQGAFALLRARQHPKSLFSTPSSDNDLEESSLEIEEETFVPIDELDLFFVQLDLQTASYALGLPPRLPRIDLRRVLDIPTSERQQSDLELEVTQAVHSSYRIAHALSDYKYLGRDRTPNDLAFEQARTIAQLFACLASLDRHLKCLERGEKPADTLHRLALVLRSQCLIGLIYLAMTSNSRECGYDAYGPFFQQIVEDAELLFNSDSDQSCTVGHFSIGLGILQPLFLTATKYRDPSFRRRAIELLQKGGREGPWYGPLLAAIASRAVDIEESSLAAQGLKVLAAGDVPESVRLHGIGLVIEAASISDAVQLDVTFSRCCDVAAMTSGAKKWDDEKYWDRRTETLHW